MVRLTTPLVTEFVHLDQGLPLKPTHFNEGLGEEGIAFAHLYSATNSVSAADDSTFFMMAAMARTASFHHGHTLSLERKI